MFKEEQVEQAIIEQLQGLGYEYLYGPETERDYKEVILKEEAEQIPVVGLLKYVQSDLWKELKEAKEVHKEQPFYINIPAKDVVSEAENSKKNILVQGIIDLYYIDKNDNLILIDFKTDYISNEPNAKEKILEKYKVQLEIYKTALEQALDKKISKTALCLVKSEYEEVVLE